MYSFFKEKIKHKGLIKFVLLLNLFIAYFFYLSWKYDFSTGGSVVALTWSFFVLCTPIADAGFLIDFPVRIITGLKMFISEVIVWVLAISINLIFITYSPATYNVTFITSLFYKILTNPWPYWSIIFLCAIGTFLSVYFGDEMMDKISHKNRKLHNKHIAKYRLTAMFSIIIVIIIAYSYLLEMLEIKIEL